MIGADKLPKGRVLMIHPAYVHYGTLPGGFIQDPSPFLPLSQLYAGQLVERETDSCVEYFDCQLHDLNEKADLHEYDSFGISAMGAQDVAPALVVFRYLVQHGISPNRIFLGGQGVEPLTAQEYERVFPGSNQVPRHALTFLPGYMDTVISSQVDKLPISDLKIYLIEEMTLLLGQGCRYACTFCGAQNKQQEGFYNTKDNLEYLLTKAKEHGFTRLKFYCTSLDFFQQALPGENLALLVQKLQQIIDLQERYGISLELRALTRANSYNAAMKSAEVLSLVKAAGFRKFGFGADGAASVDILKAMRRGTIDLKSDLINAFSHAEKHGLIPEMLYVFGVPEDTEETLRETRDLLVGLLAEFPHSQYRGFPAKNEIPGNRNWLSPAWKTSESYKLLFSSPELFLNVGFETLANAISHPDESKRKLVNRYATEMSLKAHEFNRVQSYLTVPIMFADGRELMDEEAFEWLIEIISRYVEDLSEDLTLENLPSYRAQLNRHIPKDR